MVKRYLGTKNKELPLNFGNFSEFFSDLQREIASQAFEAAADENNCISFEDAVPLIRLWCEESSCSNYLYLGK